MVCLLNQQIAMLFKYAMSYGLSKGITFLNAIVLVFFYETGGYSEYIVFLTTSLVVSVFIDAGTDSFIFSKKSFPSGELGKLFVPTSVFIYLFHSCFCALALWLMVRYSVSFANLVGEIEVYQIVLYAFSECVYKMMVSCYRYTENQNKYIISIVLFELVSILPAYASFYFIENLTISGFISSLCLARATIAIASLYRAFYIDGNTLEFPKTRVYRKFLSYGVPLLPHLLSVWVIAYIDRFMILEFGTRAMMGEYSVFNQVAQIVCIVSTAFMLWFHPWYSKKYLSEPLAVKKVVLGYYISLGLILALMVVLGEYLISLFFPSVPYYGYFLFLVTGYCFQAMYKPLQSYYYVEERTIVISSLTALALVTNVVLNFIFIPKYMAKGAAFSTFMSYLVYFLSMLMLASYRSKGRLTIFG